MAELFQLPGYAALAPALILGLTALALLVYDMIDPDSRDRGVLVGISLVGSLASLAVTAWYLGSGVGVPAAEGGRGVFRLFGSEAAPQLVVDQMSLFFTLIFTSVTSLVVVASYDYLEDHEYQAEFYSLVLLAATGMTLMASANSLVVAFVSLELASLPSFALVAFLKDNKGSVEAGLKYFLVGALSSAVFAYGISLVYAETGSLQLDAVATALGSVDNAGVLGLGILMILGGFAYKTASVPFHFWAPEAYEGAASPISGFLSSASKAAGFALAFRVMVVAFSLDSVIAAVDWVLAAQILAVATMTLGNFAAATQDKVKRMLAYSSIGHAGYVLIGLAAWAPGSGGQFVLGGAMMHLFVYGFMNTGAFLFIALTEHWGIGRTFEDFNGLGKEAPVASAAMTIFLVNLAGLPLGGGFVSKYVLFAGAVNAGFWWLAAVGAINSALSLFYYTRVIKAMWVEDAETEFELRGQPTGIYAAVVVAAVFTVLLLFGFGLVSNAAIGAASNLILTP